LPYLETLHALYGAGVPMKTAHTTAVGTVRLGAVASRLRLADAIVQSGRPLREALAETAALHVETRTLLHTGEQTGQLEDALRRALDRRRDVTGRNLAAVSRRVGQVAYGIAVVLCVVVIFRFYSNYLGMWRR
jgi:type II secretory pathway component PulF